MRESAFFELCDEVIAKSNKNLRFKARGSSMRPFIKDGDVVEVRPVDSMSKIKISDILFVRNELSGLFLHRFLGLKDKKLIIKGDAHRNIDGAFEFKDILGKLISVERNGRLVPFRTVLKNKISPFIWIWLRVLSFAKALLRPFFNIIQNLFLRLNVVRRALRHLFGSRIVTSVAALKDVYDISVFYQQFDRESIECFKQRITDEDGFYIISRFGKKIISAASLHFDESPGLWGGWWLTGLQTRPIFRGFGAGEAIAAFASSKVRENGGGTLKLMVNKNRKPAKSLYEKSGFERAVDNEIDAALLDEASKGLPPRIYMEKRIKNIKQHIAGEITRMSKQMIVDQSLGPFLYGTGSDVDETYRNNYAATISKNEFLLSRENEILDVVSSKKIGAISLKGTKLINDLYGDTGLRPTTDIDILIKKEDLEKVTDILGEKGYAIDESENSSSDELKSQLTFKSAQGVLVDLHWELLESERYKEVIKPDASDFWRNKIYSSSPQKESNSLKPDRLEPEEQLLFFAFHLSVPHFYSRLYWLMDIALLVDKYGSQMDWDYVIRLSKKWRIEQSILLSIKLCEDIFNLNFSYPGYKLPAMKLRTRITGRILRDKILNTSSEQVESLKFIYGLFIRDSILDSLKIFTNAIFPPKQWIIEKYDIKNPRKARFYRLMHPLYSIQKALWFPVVRNGVDRD